MSTPISIIPRNHFDPTWRRAFVRPITHNGVTVQPYARVEEEVFERWLALAPRGYSFSESQTAVWREYLRRNPARLERLKAELVAGRLCVQLAGETVQDTSLPASEGLIRNFLVALPFYRELGVAGSPAQEVAWVEDAFGNSPNYPQVLAGVGAKAVAKLTYRSIPGPVWTGIDGTSLACMDQLVHQAVWPVTKHPPCPACRGSGCTTCGNAGMVWASVLEQAEVEAILERAIIAQATDPLVHVTLGGEETLPDACVFAAIAAVTARHPTASFRFATWADLWTAQRAGLLAAVAAHDGTPSADLNPAMPGCQVTRIALKQRTRDLAHRLGEAESVLATRSWQTGVAMAQPEELCEAWRLVAFNQFHDAITGTLVDGGADELHGMLDRASALAERHAPPRPLPPAPALFATPTTTAGCIRLGQLEVSYDQRGLTAVAHAGRRLCAMRPLSCTREAMRIGELGLESDFGDAWGKRIAPLDQYGCAPLSDFHTGVEVASHAGQPVALRWQGTYAGGDRKVKRLTWTMTVRASADGQALDFAVEVDWHAESRRLRAWFPVVGTQASATYEVPFGHVDRAFDGSKWDYTLWSAQQNEFPMQNWIRAACIGGGHAALISRGLPGVRWMPGTATQPGSIDLSLLRAPESEFCQVETHFYEFWDNAGMLDGGRHAFAYQLRVDAAGLSPADLTAAGLAFNRPAFVTPPFIVEGAQVSAWKPAEDGHGWILRVHDASGLGGMVALRFNEERTVTATDLLERPNGTAHRGRSWSGPLRKHGIQTVRIV